MDKGQLEVIIYECLKEILTNSEINSESDLEENGMDSMNFIRLIVDLEDRLNIEINDEDMLLENFVNVKSITELLYRYVN